VIDVIAIPVGRRAWMRQVLEPIAAPLASASESQSITSTL
jgi:hypothetical protein